MSNEEQISKQKNNKRKEKLGKRKIITIDIQGGATGDMAPTKISGGALQLLFLYFCGAVLSYLDKITIDLKNAINFS